jgi:hypothetical protein
MFVLRRKKASMRRSKFNLGLPIELAGLGNLQGIPFQIGSFDPSLPCVAGVPQGFSCGACRPLSPSGRE